MALLLAALPAHAADTVTASNQNGYSRLNFNFAPQAHVTAAVAGSVLTLSFDRKVTFDSGAVTALMGAAAANGRADPDGKTFRFVLSQPLKLHQSQTGARAVVDLAPENFTGSMPDLPPPAAPAPPKPVDMASLPELKLRSGAYANFTRLVFDWPRDVAYQVFPGAGKLTIRFQAAVRPDLSVIARFAPPWVKNAAWHLDGTTTVVEFETDSDSGFHDFKDGTKVVLDVLAPKTDATAYAPPGVAKPTVTKMAAAPVSGAQAQAIADTAAQLAARSVRASESDQQKAKPTTPPVKTPDVKIPDTKTADTKTPDPRANAATKPPTTLVKAADTKATPATAPATPPVKTADAKAAPVAATPAATPATATPAADTAPSGVQVTDSHLTKAGAVLSFKGAGTRGSAVFIRGLTAWIVLQNAPGFDSAALKSALSSFAGGLEASSSPGVSILRITLKQPAQIAARGDGADLKVVIAADVGAPPIAIGFARNQDDPRRASFTTLLPGADKVFALTDPATGDILTVVPAAAGRAMLTAHVYAEFAALQTASGIVLTPYTDDLSATVSNARVTITRPGGLSLTPPLMPVAQSPSALAHPGDGPSYLDFASWGTLTGGSFLATERRLSQSVSRLKTASANPARLTLARFYLANHFAAEALGLLNLIQASDPSLAGDPQLVTMRAAADYMMGRYRDAHNDLAGSAFDADRHAAFWRGLTEAAMENWQGAHALLDQAGPVMKRYPAEWQARAHLSDAEAALGLGRLELADAAITKMPATLSHNDALEAQLAKARITAAENRYKAAAPQFVAVENGGVESLAAQAIFYQAGAALSAGAIDPKQAVDILERLRFRWRGDGLEMRTLRKLASLYFGMNRWQDGLKTLRVATQNFEGNDAARAAQDDMRAAFVNLFLKGAADKIAPVEALALFYDNKDLTPIGADGDEMIRHMADRLVAVDLLGPAADLLSYQVNNRLDGIAKASVSTRLAEIYLMDHKAQPAIDILHGSQITGLPDDVGHQRLLLEARAFAALKQWNNALDLIGVDEAPDTRRLRADIYWESGNWDVAGQKTEELLDTRWSDAVPLTDADRGEVLRMAVAYSLANDEAGLDRIRAHFGPKMKGTPDANAFAVLAQSIDLHGLAFRDAAAQIASVDTLESFMKDFDRRHEVVATN